MRFTSTILGLATIAAASAEVKTIKVTVGESGLLKYNPATVVAEVGTKIEFEFFPKNHTVTQSSFADPCHPLDGGFFSGFVPTKNSPSGTSFTITVKDTKPIWFYCGQGNHCQSGMVGAINAPASGNTFEAFAEKAKQASNSSSPPGGAAGGELKGSSSSNSTSTSSSSSGFSPGSSSVQVSSSAYTTKAVTSTWTSNGATFTTTASTTLFTAAPAATTTSSTGSSSVSKGAAATAASKFNALNAGALIVAVAAIF